MLLALRLHRRLAEELGAPGKLGIELVVQVDAVGHDHDGGAVQRLLQEMGVEDHGQGLAAALGVPEDAALAVGGGGGHRFLHRLADGEVLVIPGQNLNRLLGVAGKEDEILQNVQQPLPLEHTLVEGVKLGIGGVLIAAVFGLPLHEAVQAGGDGARPVGGQVADNADGVVDKQGGDVLDVVAQLVVGVLHPRVLLGGAFQLHDHQGQAVEEQNHVRAAGAAVFDVCILVYHIEGVVVRVLVVHQADQGGALLPLGEILHLYAVLEIPRENPVLLHQTAAVKVFQLCHGFLNGLLGQVPVQAHQAVQQHRVQQRAGAVRPVQVGGVDVGVAHLGEELDDGGFVGGFGEGHKITSIIHGSTFIEDSSIFFILLSSSIYW